MSRSGELSGLEGYYNRNSIQSSRLGQVSWRGDNKISLLDGKLEDNVCRGRLKSNYDIQESDNHALKGVGSIRSLR